MNYDLAKLKNRTSVLIGTENAFKAAVLIPLIKTATGYDVLFEVRSGSIPDQPGDVCFPGGANENAESFENTAIRETCEELLVLPEQIKIIGNGDIMHSGKTIIYSYAGLLKEYTGTFNTSEVSEVFKVPLEFFLTEEPERHIVDSVIRPREDFPYDLIAGGKNYKWRDRSFEELFFKYGGHVIWGLTARILDSFCRIITS